jgi:hypothetical protein
VGKYLSEAFHIQNGLNEGNVLSPLLLKFALKCVARKLQIEETRRDWN